MAESLSYDIEASSVRGVSTTPTNPGSRPYRSHKIPACDFCRRRKTRCTRDNVERACLPCRMYGAQCSTAIDSRLERNGTRKSRSAPKSKRARASAQVIRRDTTISANNQQQGNSRTSEADGMHDIPDSASKNTSNQSGHIVGPPMARDAQLLEQYLSPTGNRSTTTAYARSTPYSIYSDDPRNPVVYMKVPRQRGIPPAGNGTSSFSQFETMQKILEPLGPELLNM